MEPMMVAIGMVLLGPALALILLLGMDWHMKRFSLH
jgi:hypothetical protein